MKMVAPVSAVALNIDFQRVITSVCPGTRGHRCYTSASLGLWCVVHEVKNAYERAVEGSMNLAALRTGMQHDPADE